MLFQKRVVRTQLDIYILIFDIHVFIFDKYRFVFQIVWFWSYPMKDVKLLQKCVVHAIFFIFDKYTFDFQIVCGRVYLMKFIQKRFVCTKLDIYLFSTI